MKQITGVELFAGAGGLALGLEQAGIVSRLFVEMNAAACSTLRYNRPVWHVVESDIHALSFTSYEDRLMLLVEGLLVRHFHMLVNVLALVIRAVLYLLNLRAVLKKLSQRCFYLKMSIRDL